VIPSEAHYLKDLIFAAVRSRGVDLREVSFRVDEGAPSVRFGIEGANLAGARIRIPGGGTASQKVITVSGPSGGWSRSWQRRRDDTFDIEAVAAFLMAMVEHERAKPAPPELQVPKGEPVSSSGLHVIHLAAVRLAVLPPETTPQQLLARVGNEGRRLQIEARLERRGVVESDLRVLVDATPMHLWRPNKVAHDPFEPLSNDYLPIAVVGRATSGGVERRYVLVLDYERPEVVVADPAGDGLVEMPRQAFLESWRLGAIRDRAWVGLVGPKQGT